MNRIRHIDIRLIRNLLLLTIGLFILGCSHGTSWQTEVAWEELDFHDLPGKEEYPNAGAVILLDEGRMDLSGGSEIDFSTFEKHRIVKILDKTGLKHANVVIPYNPSSEIEYIEARTISPDGEISILDEEDIYDVTMFPNFIFYSDQRAKRFTMPAVEEGSVIEYRYRLTIWSLTFWHSWRFQDTDPVLLSRFTLHSPSDWDVNFRTYGMDLKPDIINAPSGFNSTHTWEKRNIDPIRAEVGMPSLKNLTQRLALAPAGVETWDDVSNWYYNLARPRTNSTDEMRDLVEELTQNANSDYAKLKSIFEWVRDQVRYIAVEIGIGGYQPHYAGEVAANQYGDCKDMVTLLCSLAEEAGIDVHQTLVSTWQNGVPDTTLPSQFQFNHVIAYAPEVTETGIWMDPTEKGAEFDQLPWYDQGLPVLMVGEKGEGQFITTPQASPEENRIELDWNVELTDSGAAVIHGSKKLYGAPASDLRETLLQSSHEERQNLLEGELSGLCSGVTLDSFTINGILPVQDPLRLDYTFHTSTFTVPRLNEMTVRPGKIASFNYPDYFRATSRVHPVQFRYGLHNNITMRVRIPEGWEIREPVLKEAVTTEFGKASWEWSADSDTFVAHSAYTMTGEEVPPGKYTKFRNFLDKVRKYDLMEAVFKERRPQIATP